MALNPPYIYQNMRIILYHAGKCTHGHDAVDFSKELFTWLVNRSLPVFPVKPPSRRVVACQLMGLNGESKPNILKDFLRESDDYILIVIDPTITDPVALEWCNSGETLNNAEFFNDYLARHGHTELPVITTTINKAAVELAKPGGDRPFTILRVNPGDSTTVRAAVNTVELYQDFLA